MGIVTANLTATAGPKQLSDANSDGTVLGQTAADKIGFYGLNPGIVQPASQGTLRGARGVVTTYAVTCTPLSIAANTAAEQTFTVTGAATGQVVVITKPTAQAGLIVGMGRVSAANTVGINFGNDTAAAITPTAGETYVFNIFPAAMVQTATLTPAAVQPNATTEQQFALSGLPAGAAVVVNKPTAQAGLAVVNARAVSAGTLGVTFANFTAATITPTAAEAYLVLAATEVAIQPIAITQTATLAPTSVASKTTAEQTFTVPNLPANAQVSVSKPSYQAGLGIGGARVSAANTLAITFVNESSTTLTPATETYAVLIMPGAAPAAGSSTAYNGQMGGATTDHAALVALGLIAAP